MTAALSEYLIRPELLTSVVVSACTFEVDFAAGTLLADAVFQVSTVTSAPVAGQSKHSSMKGLQHKDQRGGGGSSSGGCDRLELGSLVGRVSICLPARDIEFSFARPTLKVINFTRDAQCVKRGRGSGLGRRNRSPPRYFHLNFPKEYPKLNDTVYLCVSFIACHRQVVLETELQRAAAVVAELRGFDDIEAEDEEDVEEQPHMATAAASREAPMDNRAEREISTSSSSSASSSSPSTPSSTPLPLPGGGLFRGLSNLVGEAWRPEPTPCLYNRDAAVSEDD